MPRTDRTGRRDDIAVPVEYARSPTFRPFPAAPGPGRILFPGEPRIGGFPARGGFYGGGKPRREGRREAPVAVDRLFGQDTECSRPTEEDEHSALRNPPFHPVPDVPWEYGVPRCR